MHMHEIGLGVPPTDSGVDADYAVRIGALIRDQRIAHDLTLQELAGFAGMHHPTLSRLERGYGGDVKLSTLRRLARALRVSVTALLPEGQPSRDAAPGERASPTEGGGPTATTAPLLTILERMYDA